MTVINKYKWVKEKDTRRKEERKNLEGKRSKMKTGF